MSDEEDRLARAGDYVLGLMDEAERARAEADMAADPAFGAAVARLAERMQALDDTAPGEAVPAGMWEAVAARIDGEPQESAALPAATVVPFSGRKAPRRFGWRPGLMAASLLAAGGIGYVAGTTFSTPDSPVVVVVLNTPEQVPGAVFEAFADDSLRIVPLQDFVVPDGKTLQVWTLYDPAVGPVSMGTLPRSAVSVLRGPHLPLPRAEQLYEITLEPAPGSPTGRPTGPILVKGFAKRPAG